MSFFFTIFKPYHHPFSYSFYSSFVFVFICILLGFTAYFFISLSLFSLYITERKRKKWKLVLARSSNTTRLLLLRWGGHTWYKCRQRCTTWLIGHSDLWKKNIEWIQSIDQQRVVYYHNQLTKQFLTFSFFSFASCSAHAPS